LLDEYDLIRSRPFLRQVYRAFYQRMADALGPLQKGHVLELGSGGGCIKDILPLARTSDIAMMQGIDIVCSAYRIPVAYGQLDAILMLNVFHHLADPDSFLREAFRCLRPGGLVVMIDPTNGWFARFIWRFHHEVFYAGADYNRYVPNQALAWIIFVSQASSLPDRCPGLRIRKVERFSDLAYVASGGLRHTLPIPAITYPVFEWIDRCLGRHMALMQMVVLEKIG